MNKNDPAYQEFLHTLRYEIQQAQRPACETILDDEDAMRTLKFSKRKLQTLKSERIIPYHYLEPDGVRTYYLLSDILQMLKENRIESISNDKRIK